jgi:hypothetical protein
MVEGARTAAFKLKLAVVRLPVQGARRVFFDNLGMKSCRKFLFDFVIGSVNSR